MKKLISRFRVWLAKRICQIGSNMLTTEELEQWAEEKQAHADRIRKELCEAGFHEFLYGVDECFRCGKLVKPIGVAEDFAKAMSDLYNQEPEETQDQQA